MLVTKNIQLYLWFLLPVVSIGFAQASFTVLENYTTVTVLLNVTGEASRNLTISVSTEDGTATGKSGTMHNNLVWNVSYIALRTVTQSHKLNKSKIEKLMSWWKSAGNSSCSCENAMLFNIILTQRCTGKIYACVFKADKNLTI